MDHIAELSRDELNGWISDRETFYLVEALPEEYFGPCHLPGAINLPFEKVPNWAAERLPNKATKVAIYCMNTRCLAAEDAARELLAMGYRRVLVYRGGKQDWVDAGLPTEGTDPRKPRAPVSKLATAALGGVDGEALQRLFAGHIGELFDAVVTAIQPETSIRLLRPSTTGLIVKRQVGLVVGDEVRVRLLSADSGLEFIRVSRHTH